MVTCGFWVFDALRFGRAKHCGCRVVPLFDEPERLEARIRQAVNNGRDCAEPTVLVDMGLGEECRQICERLSEETGMFYICGEAELCDALRRLEGVFGYQDLQMPENIV
jgi:hypothetical protein